jgi:hypothetical protein
MTIKLNTPSEAYKEFYGRNTEQMPKLIADGRVPMNVPQLMQRRLEVRKGPGEVKTAWVDNYFDTSDLPIYHPNGDLKIVYTTNNDGSLTSEGRILLPMITPESQRNGGALVLSEDVYKALEGEVFKKGKLGKTGDSMSKADVKADPVWKVLARDQALLNDYTDFIFAEGKERFGYGTAMGVYLGSCGGDKPEMRAWYVRGLDYRSDASGWDGLDVDYGRLVGIAPEALGALSNGSSNVRTYSMADVKTARKQLDQVAEFMKPESVDKVKSLLEKL